MFKLSDYVAITCICIGNLFAPHAVAERSSKLFHPMFACVDTDGDGWGWDGWKSCRPDENTHSVPLCLDRDGDGWGWNGQSSCRGTGSQIRIKSLQAGDGVAITDFSRVFGTGAARLGDINNDGYSDVMIAGPDQVVVIHGGPDSQSIASQPADIDGSNGFHITLEPFLAGGSITGLSSGFIDGDDKLDAVISMSINGPAQAGSPYLVFILYGNALTKHTGAELQLDRTSPFGILGASTLGGWITGFSPNSDGIDTADFNGDGYDDLLLNPTGTAETVATIIFGGPTLLNDSTVYYLSGQWSQLNGANGVTIIDSSMPHIGPRVTEAGDINADGMDDLIVVLSRFDETIPFLADDIAVVFGRNDFAATIDVEDLNGSNGFQVFTSPGGGFTEASGLGDVNGDGVDDFGISTERGFAVVFGSVDNFSANLSLDESGLFAGRGFVIQASENNALLHNVGDVNADGISDILFGNGVVHLLPGRRDWPDVVSALDAHFSYTLNGSKGSSLGYRNSTGQAGDVNGDGVHDIFISAPWNYCDNFQCQDPFPGGTVGLIYSQ